MRRLGLVKEGTLAVRVDLVDRALVAGASEDIALSIDCQAPHVLIWWIKEDRACTGLIDFVDLAVRRGRGVHAAPWYQRDRVDFEFFGVKEDGACAVGIDAVDLPLVSAADEHRSVRGARERPEEGGARFVERRRGRPKREPAVRVDRHVLDIALEELGFRGDLPERGQRRLHPRHRGAHGGARDKRRQAMSL